MSLTTCTIHFTPKPDRTIYVTKELMEQLHLINSKRAMLKLGQSSHRVSLKTIRRKGKHLYIPTNIQSILNVPRSGNCMIYSNELDELQLGPLIGIMTSTTPNSNKPFGVHTSVIRNFLQVGHRKSFYFAFSPDDINWGDLTVIGHFLDHHGRWSRRTVSLPDVIYNRLLSRKLEGSESITQLKERLVRLKIPLFNWSFFSKAEVYSMLEKEPDAAVHIPESVAGPSSAKIKEMLERHQFIYLKPTNGYLGFGIYRLTYSPKNGYYARFRRGNQNMLLQYSRFSSLMNMLTSKRGRLKNYIAQQGVRLIETDQCPIDFRFHMNKNARNKWVTSGIGAKKAGRGSVTTHVKNGGQLLAPQIALSQTFGAHAEEVLDNARQVTVRLAEAIERNYEHSIGEIGFDIGIDKDAKVWMFEANAKPGRTIFKHPSLKKQGIAQLHNIYEHCLYLSKFFARR